MQVLPAKAKTRRKLHRKVFERIKESKCRTLVNIYESNILETQMNYPEVYVLLKVQMA